MHYVVSSIFCYKVLNFERPYVGNALLLPRQQQHKSSRFLVYFLTFLRRSFRWPRMHQKTWGWRRRRRCLWNWERARFNRGRSSPMTLWGRKSLTSGHLLCEKRDKLREVDGSRGLGQHVGGVRVGDGLANVREGSLKRKETEFARISFAVEKVPLIRLEKAH